MTLASRSAVRAALFLFALTAVGCASSYKPVSYSTLDYTGTQASNGLDFAYRYEAQEGYYAKKARKEGFDVVAVRVTNTLDQPVTLNSTTLRVLVGGTPVIPPRPEMVADNMQQPVWTYLLWSLLTFSVLEDGEPTVIIPVGVPISLINMLQSSSSNRRMAEAYRAQYLLGKTVPAGSTLEGLLFLRDGNYAPLTFEHVGAGTPAVAPASANTN